MSIELRYLGWSAFDVTIEDGRRLLLDPYLSGRPGECIPPSPAKIEEFDDVDFVLVTHVAQDHIGQALDVMGRSMATLVCDVATRFTALAAGRAVRRGGNSGFEAGEAPGAHDRGPPAGESCEGERLSIAS